MCKNCKTSELGNARQTELDAAIQACQSLNINVATAGFIARHSFSGHIPQQYRSGTIRFTEEEQTALDRYNTAQDAMKELHDDYVLALARRECEEAKRTGVRPFYITHADPR